MIAKTKVVSNKKEIEANQKEYQETVKQNEILLEKSKSKNKFTEELKELPKIIEPTFKNNDLGINLSKVSLFFVNADDDIAIKYDGELFSLVNEPKTLKALTEHFKNN